MGIFNPTRTRTHELPGPTTRVRVPTPFLKGTGMGKQPTGVDPGSMKKITKQCLH